MIEPSKLHAYVDGELTDAERQDVECQLANCQASQAEVASIKGLKAALGQASNVECEVVWANCKNRLDTIDRVAKSGNFITKYSWAFVTGVALFVLIGGGYARHTQAGSVDSSALAGIFSSSSKPTVERQARNANLDQLLKVANRNLSQVKPIGVTNMMIDGQIAQRIDLEDGQGRMSLIVLPEVTSFDGMAPDKDGKYFRGPIDANNKGVGWRTHRAALVLVGQRDYNDLETVAKSNFLLAE